MKQFTRNTRIRSAERCSVYCCRDIKPQIYPGREFDLEGYVTSSVMVRYICFLYTCFIIGSNTNLTSVGASIPAPPPVCFIPPGLGVLE